MYTDAENTTASTLPSDKAEQPYKPCKHLVPLPPWRLKHDQAVTAFRLEELPETFKIPEWQRCEHK